MGFARGVAIAAVTVLAVAAARAEEPAHAPRTDAEPSAHTCLDQKERRAENEAGRLVHLGTAMRVVKSRMPGTVVRARLCRSNDGLVYVLTVLGRDGKVARLTVDAVKGTLVGGL
jgi:uncharacterized membrane protein YkoI